MQAGVDFDPNDPTECHAAVGSGLSPSIPYSTAKPPVENLNGTWSLTFDAGAAVALGQILPDGTFSFEFPTEMRSRYQQNGGSTTPVVGRDSWANQVAVTGTAAVICGGADPLCQQQGATPIASDQPGGGPVADVSEAGQSAGSDTIAVYIGVPVGGACSDPSIAWRRDADPRLSFTYGDRVCYRLTATIAHLVASLNPVVTDFVPPHTTYVPGSAVILPGNTVSMGPPTQAAGTVEWRLGLEAGGQPCAGAGPCYALPDQVFNVALAVDVAGDPKAAGAGELTGNLMKYRSANSGGTVSPLRDQVSFAIAEPTLTLAKTSDALGRQGRG